MRIRFGFLSFLIYILYCIVCYSVKNPHISGLHREKLIGMANGFSTPNPSELRLTNSKENEEPSPTTLLYAKSHQAKQSHQSSSGKSVSKSLPSTSSGNALMSIPARINSGGSLCVAEFARRPIRLQSIQANGKTSI